MSSFQLDRRQRESDLQRLAGLVNVDSELIRWTATIDPIVCSLCFTHQCEPTPDSRSGVHPRFVGIRRLKGIRCSCRTPIRHCHLLGQRP
jgi:hypothetical protein